MTYREAQSLIEAETPKQFHPRQRAYLLLKEHGQTICKRVKPKCSNARSARIAHISPAKTADEAVQNSVKAPIASRGAESSMKISAWRLNSPRRTSKMRWRSSGSTRCSASAQWRRFGRQLFTQLDEESNSIAIIVKHLTGNMRSRFSDFLTADGEKPDRNRDNEFVDPPATREAICGNGKTAGPVCFSDRTADRCGSRSRGHDSRRGPFGDAGDKSAACALSAARRPDCSAGETFRRRAMADVQRAAQQSAEFNRKVASGEASQR